MVFVKWVSDPPVFVEDVDIRIKILTDDDPEIWTIRDGQTDNLGKFSDDDDPVAEADGWIAIVTGLPEVCPKL